MRLNVCRRLPGRGDPAAPFAPWWQADLPTHLCRGRTPRSGSSCLHASCKITHPPTPLLCVPPFGCAATKACSAWASDTSHQANQRNTNLLGRAGCLLRPISPPRQTGSLLSSSSSLTSLASYSLHHVSPPKRMQTRRARTHRSSRTTACKTQDRRCSGGDKALIYLPIRTSPTMSF